ncbi:MAG: c-type cytochrome domain-containing protein, partial [Chthoniobacteraceae bacterium]
MSTRIKRICVASVVATLQLPYFAGAAAVSDLAQLDFFEKKIRPVLSKECYECHSADAKKLKGGLQLDTADGLLKGGDSGPAIVRGKPEKSLLLTTMRHEDKDPDMAMPPKKDKLSDEVLADFEKWVKMGAPDPRDGKASRKLAWDADTAKKHWAYQKISNPPVPKVADPKHFIQNPIDSFVLAKLAEKKLAPSAKADKQTLIRR